MTNFLHQIVAPLVLTAALAWALTGCTLVQTTKHADISLEAYGLSGLEPTTGMLVNFGWIKIHWVRDAEPKAEK